MYIFVPYNLSDIQKGIQAGHCALEYAREYCDTELFKEFVSKHKTWIVLNGGTTNARFEDGHAVGSLNEILNSLILFNIDHKGGEIDIAEFYEPDLNDALTGVCFVCDQRVWDYELVPSLEGYIYDEISSPKTIDQLRDDWIKMIGGEKNAFLRELIAGKKLA